MRFQPNDSLICMQAPWHEPGAPGCAFAAYGPKVNDLIEVDYYVPYHREYLALKEYPTLEPPNHWAFNEKFFQRVMNTDALAAELKQMQER